MISQNIATNPDLQGKEKMEAFKKCIVIVLLTIITITAAAGCSVQKDADENTDSDKNSTLYFTDQPVRESPEWVTDLDE